MSIELKAKKREKSTKGFVKELRRKGQIPAICYGKENVSVSVDSIELNKILTTVRQHIIFDLDIEGDKKRSVLLKAFDINPIYKNITHIDFLEVSKDRSVIAKVPLVLTGQSIGAKRGGVLEHKLQKLTIKCLPESIPAEIKVDVTNLEVGDSTYVQDLKLDEKIKVLAKPKQGVAAVAASRTTRMADQQAKDTK